MLVPSRRGPPLHMYPLLMVPLSLRPAEPGSSPLEVGDFPADKAKQRRERALSYQEALREQVQYDVASARCDPIKPPQTRRCYNSLHRSAVTVCVLACPPLLDSSSMYLGFWVFFLGSSRVSDMLSVTVTCGSLLPPR